MKLTELLTSKLRRGVTCFSPLLTTSYYMYVPLVILTLELVSGHLVRFNKSPFADSF
jgi:hypothetical protein